MKLKKINPVVREPIIGSNTHKNCINEHLVINTPLKNKTNLNKTPQKKPN